MSTSLDNKPVQDANPEEALVPGTTLLNRQYEIENYLSAGGFGITYLAKDSLQRPVVIKECYPEAFCRRENQTVRPRTRAQQGDFRSFVTLFVREARSLSKLRHPNVVGVHQVFEDNSTAYMALDLIDGVDLLSVIEDPQKELTADQVQQILLKILDAVALIHSRDILHRDISPDNILIDQNCNPVLIDFGAAREEASKKSRALSNVLVVKDGYSPQEFYFGGSKQGPFSDLYALAATFYHLISGAAPPHSQSRLAEIAAENPDPCAPLVNRFPEYPNAFLSAIDKAMSVFPKDRIQTALEWSQWIETNGAVSLEAQRAAVNTKSIKAMMQTLPSLSIAPDVTSQMPDKASITAKKAFEVDLSDLRKKSGHTCSEGKNLIPSPSFAHPNRKRRPIARFLVSGVLLSAATLTTLSEAATPGTQVIGFPYLSNR